jgi:hypothetical protein
MDQKTFSAMHRELIIALARRHQLPAVYPFRYYVTSGGLISYGPDPVDQFRLAAREAGRAASAGADQVRAGDQRADRQDARPQRAADAARPRRRGDRMKRPVALGGKADIRQ